MTLPLELLEILVCPKCRVPLLPRGAAPEALECAACRLSYPVRDGIPILIVDDALPIG